MQKRRGWPHCAQNGGMNGLTGAELTLHINGRGDGAENELRVMLLRVLSMQCPC